MYSLTEIQQKLNDLEIENYPLRGTTNMIQLGEKNTTIHSMGNNGCILYATDADFQAIVSYPWPEDVCEKTDTAGKPKQWCLSFIEKDPHRIYCLQHGNHTMNEGAPQYQPHRVYLYSDENMDTIMEILAANRKGGEGKKMTKIDCVWIGAAILTYDTCQNNSSWKLEDICFSQQQIVNAAQKLAGEEIPNALVSQHACADSNSQNKNCMYLVAEDIKRRISYTGEFPGKRERPEFSEMRNNISVPTEHGKIAIDELIKFVDEEYSPKMQQFLEKHSLKQDATEEADDVTVNADFHPNMILYGPPGTGKTYHSVIYSVAICDGKSIEEIEKKDYDTVKARYEELKLAGRIAFTTFHQSYGYEEFIEGIRPVMEGGNTISDAGDDSQLRYRVEPGVFKKFCEEAGRVEVKTDKFDYNRESVIWKVTIRPEVREDCFRNNRIRINWGMDSDGAAGFVNDMKKGDLILATDGSRSVICGIAVVTSEEAFDLEEEENRTTRNVTWLVTGINEDIRAVNAGKMLHRMTCARVPQMAVADVVALAMKKNHNLVGTRIEENKKPYVFIIDEINRGNISKIFGELITLIEDTKRQGMPEQASAILPYSKEAFSVPSNVYILGTMNTADRSIALMDTALRRRFRFVEKMPQPELLYDVTIEQENKTVNIGKMLELMNRRIEFLFDREHTIGHAFFMKLKTNPDMDTLAGIFRQSVIPLLQEYFYEDYEKIRLVLGDNGKEEEKYQFIKNQQILPSELFRRGSRLEKSNQYEVNDPAFQWIESYIGIFNSSITAYTEDEE